MKVLWAIICESSSVDQETNNISLFNVLEHVQVPEPPAANGESSYPPAAPFSYRLIASFCRTNLKEPERGIGRIRLQFPNEAGDGFFPEFEIDLEDGDRHMVVGRFPFMPISGQGTYTYTIESLTDTGDWLPMFEVPLEVSFEMSD